MSSYGRVGLDAVHAESLPRCQLMGLVWCLTRDPRRLRNGRLTPAERAAAARRWLSRHTPPQSVRIAYSLYAPRITVDAIVQRVKVPGPRHPRLAGRTSRARKAHLPSKTPRRRAFSQFRRSPADTTCAETQTAMSTDSRRVRHVCIRPVRVFRSTTAWARCPRHGPAVRSPDLPAILLPGWPCAPFSRPQGSTHACAAHPSTPPLSSGILGGRGRSELLQAAAAEPTHGHPPTARNFQPI